MAIIEMTLAAPGVTRKNYPWGYDLEGTKDALIAARIAKVDWFWNGRRGKDGRRLTAVHFKIDGYKAKCQPYRSKPGTFVISVEYPRAKDDEDFRRFMQRTLRTTN